MNPISQTVAAFTQSIAAPRFATEYARARPAHPELAPHDGPADVLAALSSESPLSREAKDALLVALVAEHQRTRHPLWQSLLLATYEGMLHNIARATLGVSRADAQQGALLGFLSALASMKLDKPPRLLSLWLKQTTERTAFGQACFAEEPDAEPVGRREPDPRRLEDALDIEDRMNGVVRELVDLFGDGEQAREILDVLLYARCGKGQLLEYVDDKYVGLSIARRDRIIARLHRMRARAMARLQEVFGDDLDFDVEADVA
jgi:hypothetical protein